MNKELRLLILEDSERDATLLVRQLKKGGYNVDFDRVDSPDSLTNSLQEKTFDLIISDFSMPSFNALDALDIFRKTGLDIPFIVVSGAVGEETAIQVMRAGAHDFLLKGQWERLLPAIERELQECTVRQENKASQKRILQEQAKAQQYLDIAGVLLFSLDREGCVTLMNKKGCEILGYPEEEIIGKNWFDNFLPEALRSEVREVFKLLIADKVKLVEYYENPIITKSGEERLLAWHNSLIRDENSKITGIFSSATDISETKRSRDRLRDSERRLEYAQSIAKIGSWELDIERNHLTWSRENYHIFGMSPEEFGASYEAFLNRVHPDDRDYVNRVYTDSLKTGKPYGIVHRLLMKDGTIKYVNEKCETIFDENGKPLLSRGTTQDVTEQRRHENRISSLLELTTSMEEFDESSLMQNALDIIQDLTDSSIGFFHFVSEDQNEIELVTWSHDTLVHYCNAAFDKHYPVDSAGIWADCIREHKPVIINDYPALNVKKGLPEGHAHLQRFISVPIIEGNKVKMVVGVGNAKRDYIDGDVNTMKLFSYELYRIIQRKRAEEKLRKLNNAIEQAADMVVITDIDGIIEYVNPAFEEKTEYQSQEVIGKKTSILSSGKQDDTYYKNLWQEIISGKVWKGSLINKKKSGQLYEEAMTISPVHNENNKISHFVAIKTDISKEKELQRQLIHTEKLSTVGTFVAGVAHELNNPLTSVIGYTEMLLEDENLPEKTKKMLKVIFTQAERTVEIVKNLLKFSRKEDSDMNPLSLHDILDSVIQLQSHRLKGNNIEVYREYSANDSKILGNTSQLQQVFMNIMVNAQYAISESAQSGTITCRIKPKNGQLIVEIENDGPAIPSEHITKLFDPFFTTKKEGDGTGLGMYITHQIIKSHGGKIGVQNIGISGVCFTINLPLHSEEKIEVPSSETHEINISGLKVLLIDDEEPIREYLARIFLKEGSFCVVAKDGEEGIRLLHDYHYDFVISDIKMPNASGIDVAEWLHEHKPHQLKRFTFLTGMVDPSVEELCRKYQCSLLIKPVTQKKLMEVIYQTLNRRK